MIVIGLCGGSGAGKSVVSSLFDEFDVKHIDTDKVYHKIISTDTPCSRELIASFGDAVVTDGLVDRKKLGKIIFSDLGKRSELNSIAHRHILNEVRTLLESYRASGAAGAIVDAPLLFESGFDKECDFTIAVIADKAVRINRITNRDNISVETAGARINAQLADEELLAKCDFTINNSGSTEELREQVRSLYNTIFKK